MHLLAAVFLENFHINIFMLDYIHELHCNNMLSELMLSFLYD